MDWTGKIILIGILSFLFFLGINIFVGWVWNYRIGVSLIVSVFCYPFLILFSALLILPFAWSSKKYIFRQAKKKLKQFPQLIIIGITGSYGKTSTKEYLKHILSEKFNVLATPGTYNTEIGVSQFILKNLSKHTEILILEMGAYVPGDIQKLCNLTPLDIGILTGITEQHLERFGNIATIVRTKFELAKNIKPGGLFVFDEENIHIKSGLVSHQQVLEEVQCLPIGHIKTSLLPKFAGIQFLFEGQEYTSKLLGKHNAKNICLAIVVAKKLGMETSLIKRSISTIGFVPHRLELIKNPLGTLILDDSFNGNKAGFFSTLNLLAETEFSGKKIYVTPGLVELGALSPTIHFDIGKTLARCADIVLLIKNHATDHIEKGLIAGGFSKENIHIYATAIEAHKHVQDFLHPGDLIVFQNDWPDNYS